MNITVKQAMKHTPFNEYDIATMDKLWNGRKSLTLEEISDLPLSLSEIRIFLFQLCTAKAQRAYVHEMAGRAVHFHPLVQAAHMIMREPEKATAEQFEDAKRTIEKAKEGKIDMMWAFGMSREWRYHYEAKASNSAWILADDDERRSMLQRLIEICKGDT